MAVKYSTHRPGPSARGLLPPRRRRACCAERQMQIVQRMGSASGGWKIWKSQKRKRGKKVSKVLRNEI